MVASWSAGSSAGGETSPVGQGLSQAPRLWFFVMVLLAVMPCLILYPLGATRAWDKMSFLAPKSSDSKRGGRRSIQTEGQNTLKQWESIDLNDAL